MDMSQNDNDSIDGMDSTVKADIAISNAQVAKSFQNTSKLDFDISDENGLDDEFFWEDEDSSDGEYTDDETNEDITDADVVNDLPCSSSINPTLPILPSSTTNRLGFENMSKTDIDSVDGMGSTLKTVIAKPNAQITKFTAQMEKYGMGSTLKDDIAKSNARVANFMAQREKLKIIQANIAKSNARMAKFAAKMEKLKNFHYTSKLGLDISDESGLNNTISMDYKNTSDADVLGCSSTTPTFPVLPSSTTNHVRGSEYKATSDAEIVVNGLAGSSVDLTLPVVPSTTTNRLGCDISDRMSGLQVDSANGGDKGKASKPSEEEDAANRRMLRESPRCSMCFETVNEMQQKGKRMLVTDCGHLMCYECVQMLLASPFIKRCPLCNKLMPNGSKLRFVYL